MIPITPTHLTTSHAWLPAVLDSGLIAESLMPLPTNLTGAESVLLVTKVLTPVQHVLDPYSPIVLAVMTAGSKMVQTAVPHVTPNVPPARVPLTKIV